MRYLAALAAMLITSAALAQNLAAPSDSDLCNHGDQAAAATQQACARLMQGGSAAMTAAASPPPTQAAPAASANAATASPPPAPTDVGEAPANQSQAFSPATADEDGTAQVSVNGSWLAGLGTAALVAVIFASLAGLALYFLPTIIAVARQKRNALPIFVLNAFLGWTFIGWVAALVWCLTAEPASSR
ncbi:MAG TPA: superinfection immunity protein [Caulobacteraceae bacterium]|jgi:hypothetical protein|nr:superinfection immunity protein [Caulobacteraceae bacterium]